MSRNRADEPKTAVPHESALALHELTEMLPDRVHLTVRPDSGEICSRDYGLHRAALTPAESEERVGFQVTTPLPTLLGIGARTTSGVRADMTVAEVLRRGFVRRRQLGKAIRSTPRPDRIEEFLGRPR